MQATGRVGAGSLSPSSALHQRQQALTMLLPACTCCHLDAALPTCKCWGRPLPEPRPELRLLGQCGGPFICVWRGRMELSSVQQVPWHRQQHSGADDGHRRSKALHVTASGMQPPHRGRLASGVCAALQHAAIAKHPPVWALCSSQALAGRPVSRSSLLHATQRYKL